MLKNLKIKSKLIVGFSVILALMLIVSVISISSLRTADEELANYASGPAQAQQQLLSAALSVNIGARAVRDMYIVEDPSRISAYEAVVNTQFQNISTALANAEATGVLDATLLAQYRTAIAEWQAIGTAVIDHIKAGDMDTAQSEFINQCSPKLDAVAQIRAQLVAQVDQVQVESFEASTLRNSLSSYVSMALLLVAFIAGVLIMIKLIRDILDPIHEVRDSMSSMSRGDLHNKPSYQSGDELGELCDSVRSSSDTLISYIDDIGRIMKSLSEGDYTTGPSVEFIGDFVNIQKSVELFIENMSDVLSQIGEVSNQVSVGSNQMAGGAQTLAQGSTEQASTVEELSDSINKVTEEIHANSANANTASKIATDMGREIEISNQQMQSTVNAMEDINAKSNEISKIVKIIDDIAFQTNILALNAAVEAARAGVAGKGFAVVADEVRNLASKSSEAASNITVLIGDSIQSVTQGNEVATKAATTLEGVVANAEEVIIKIDDIASASRVQAEATEKINLGINQISSVVQSISATAEESAAASEELASQSTMLNNLLANFVLPNGSKKAKASKSKAKPKAKAKAAPAPAQDDYYDDDNYAYDDYDDKY
ncbi:MAG: methyl-accepting chemotaxis protein [Bacillota bacterium]